MAILERLAPDCLWGTFQAVVPGAPARTGDGRQRFGDHEVLEAIVFIATSGSS
ncbi:hypothetical protein [Streptomyces yanii]|uniref:Transposase n=1 Tax=Streptomyces yanii TaxID=78510 RepID=A0ABV5RHQ4_9ACTN